MCVCECECECVCVVVQCATQHVIYVVMIEPAQTKTNSVSIGRVIFLFVYHVNYNCLLRTPLLHVFSSLHSPHTLTHHQTCPFSGKDAALQSIPQFCFPDIEQWKPTKSYQSESFSFVLTDMEGHRRFGYCRRLLVSV